MTPEAAAPSAATVNHYLGVLAADPLWRRIAAGSTVIVQGSVAVGNADAYSDVDIYAVASDPDHRTALSAALAAGRIRPGERPVVFRSPERTADGRRTLCAAELRSYEDVDAALADDLLVELWVLEHAWVVQDPGAVLTRRVATAATRFTEEAEAYAVGELGHAARAERWLAIAVQRGDGAGVGMLSARLARAVLRLACVVSGQPAPPDKWLYSWVAANTGIDAATRRLCRHLLTGRLSTRQAAEVASCVVDAATDMAALRWPEAPWPREPARYGTVRA